jgi:hypothetical protein
MSVAGGSSAEPARTLLQLRILGWRASNLLPASTDSAKLLSVEETQVFTKEMWLTIRVAIRTNGDTIRLCAILIVISISAALLASR